LFNPVKEKRNEKPASKVVATVTPKSAPVVEVPKVVTLNRSTKEPKGKSVVFTIPGVRGTVKIARTAFVGEPPTTLDVVGQPFAPPVVKMTKAERAAARAAMMPQQKAQAARARADRAARLVAKLEAAAK
jgi:hypothetical protein